MCERYSYNKYYPPPNSRFFIPILPHFPLLGQPKNSERTRDIFTVFSNASVEFICGPILMINILK